ncbi:MAG: S-adenosylmethionine:tRNA ribosyltransferase-isomerase [Bacteroidota bacterium]|nr:S-adenosylmethionine:tRNA ribosyltransferase-isomerase [Bacteroidota bacterium]
MIGTVPKAYEAIKISEFNYELPDERIAKYPLAERDLSKLLVYKEGQITDAQFRSITDYLPENSLLVFNNTRVIRARIHFFKSTGAKIELFCLDPHEPEDYALSFAQTKTVVWKCLIGNLKKWKSGPLHKQIQCQSTLVNLTAEQVELDDTTPLIRFSWDGGVSFAEVLEHAGIIPIPPYLNRETEDSDLDRYQTIYSRIQGSVAAPTAGLHFTDRVFQSLKSKNIERAELTLHVGAGTFKPVKSEHVIDHEMHTEHILVTREFIEKVIQKIDNIIAVGTTSIRTLESLYWMGIKVMHDKNIPEHKLLVEQWEPYEMPEQTPATDSMKALLKYMDHHQMHAISSSTRIIILPGYQYRIINGMVTNFHQPQSTLLLLISAFLGDKWKEIYTHALTDGYRFLSYGDSNLYLK